MIHDGKEAAEKKGRKKEKERERRGRGNTRLYRYLRLSVNYFVGIEMSSLEAKKKLWLIQVCKNLGRADISLKADKLWERKNIYIWWGHTLLK